MSVYKAARDRVLTVKFTEGFEVDFRVINKNATDMDDDRSLMEYAIMAIRDLEYETPDGEVVTEANMAELIKWVCGDMELASKIQAGYYDFLARTSSSQNSKKRR